ncbi:MAG: alkaline phosphatase family protein [Bacteroidetes bacterium]|nr:alkaline phosphatase family protein [Bacteroidota bacterium]
MLRTIFYYLKLGLMWLGLFALTKAYFLFVNLGMETQFLSNFIQVWRAGILLDLSMVGYLSVVPILGILLGKIMPRLTPKVLLIYGWFTWLFLVLVMASDAYFFYYWGQKTNLGFTQFLGKENAGLFSLETQTLIFLFIFILYHIYWFSRRGSGLFKLPEKGNIWTALVLLICSFVMIRGGVSNVPINISSAYFSNNNLLNNAAVNPAWSFLATELERDKHAPLEFFDQNDEAEKILNQQNSSTNDYTSLLQICDSNTNIVLIVLESFSAKVVGEVGGEKYASTPYLDKISKQGVSFSNAYASSFRSDKGLLAITTGFPSGARQTLTNFPAELSSKPNIFKLFNSRYWSSFYYGGNLDFANIKVLFSDANELKSQGDFSSNKKNVWGVHDEDVFQTFADDFISRKMPQFSMLFSLSSHEPFDVPNYHIKEDPYLNSIAYTDSCLGLLINQIKESDKWSNTLIIITADHGVIRPDNTPIYSETNFKIPLIFTGGVVRQDSVIHEIVSQSDLPSTLASYLNKPTVFSQQSVLQPSNYAFYSYHNGIVSVTPDCIQYYDLNHKKYLTDSCTLPFEKAYFQLANDDFFNH